MSMPDGGGMRPAANFDFSVGTEPPRSNWGCIFVAIIGVVGAGFFVMCCGGVIGLMWIGLDFVGEEVAIQLRDNPVLVEHLGPIQSFEMDVLASFQIEGSDVFVFDVRGTRGRGVITCESLTMDDGNEYVTWAKLKIPGGAIIDLLAESDPPDEAFLSEEVEAVDSF